MTRRRLDPQPAQLTRHHLVLLLGGCTGQRGAGSQASSSNAVVLTSTAESTSCTAPLPAQTRSPSTSCRASRCRQLTLRTTVAPSSVLAGATHEVTPPG